MFTVPVGQPYDEGSGACGFGLGPNAKLRGADVETAESDTLFAQLFPSDGASQYQQLTLGQTVTPLAGVGDKAGYHNGFHLSVYDLKSDQFCLVMLNLGNDKEVGLPADSSGTIPTPDATRIATKATALCADFFNASH